MNIPMVDLNAQHAAIGDELEAAFAGVIRSGKFILGPNVEALEREVAAYCGVAHAISCASGTDALHLAVRAAGIGPGDEVITTAFTFIASAGAVSYTGARPVFVDIDPASLNLDPARVERAITKRTRAILPVHLYGQPADLAPLAALCGHHGLKLIEDCAQSFGAEYGGRKSGAYGDAGCFSFYPSKNLGACGDGGMLVTNDEKIARSARVYRDHGRTGTYRHSVIGYNSRLDELQAAVLRVKLRRLDAFNRARRENAARYSRHLAGGRVATPVQDGKGLHVFHQYTIQADRRDAIRAGLAAAGIASAIYYPVPLHQQEVYAADNAGVSLPVAERAAARVLSLPMYPELTEEQIARVAHIVLEHAGPGA
ncbi:MAG: DegT/DnrJ/EryC1/StrS family aminotransferase [Betaproteobacteria bacterium]|nr:DegT/DnrJ/EryC1/StrS family aminotransferase [Betaproteobacteria bacterium]